MPGSTWKEAQSSSHTKSLRHKYFSQRRKEEYEVLFIFAFAQIKTNSFPKKFLRVLRGE